MTTRYEFGYGYGEIYRRRMRGQDRMHREMERRARDIPGHDRHRLGYESDYYGFRGAGRRGSYATEFRVQPREPRFPRGEPGRWAGRPGYVGRGGPAPERPLFEGRRGGGPSRGYRRGMEPRRWGWR